MQACVFLLFHAIVFLCGLFDNPKGEEMKKTFLWVYISFILLIFAGSMAYAQGPVPALPDYSKWHLVVSGPYSTVLNGKQVNINVGIYNNTDSVNLIRHTMVLVYNEQNSLWLALLSEEIGERQPDGSINTKEDRYYLFENQNSNWVLGKSFQSGPNTGQEIRDFLKAKYDLEFK